MSKASCRRSSIAAVGGGVGVDVGKGTTTTRGREDGVGVGVCKGETLILGNGIGVGGLVDRSEAVSPGLGVGVDESGISPSRSSNPT